LYQQILRQFHVKPKKSLGQHFLIDESVLDCILSAAELSRDDIVVEVGPGLAILTKDLALQASKVLAVELDSRLLPILKRNLSPFPNVRIIHADILKVALPQLLKDNLTSSELAHGYKVVANLPYYITSPVLRLFLEAPLKPSVMVIMVQREVGEAMAAVPGKMSLLSVRTQFYSKPSIVSYVPAKSFYPLPKVDSVILRLSVYSKPPVQVSDIASYFDIVTLGFNSPRKQLRNSLAHALGISPGQIVLLLDKAGIEAKRRAETLSLEEWRALWEVFTPFRKSNQC